MAILITSFILSIVTVPAIRRLSSRSGLQPPAHTDRWPHTQVPRLGGIAIFLAFIVSLGIQFIRGDAGLVNSLPFLVCTSLMFLVGLYDDFHPLSPHAKFIAQILISSIAIGFGYTTDFFNPRVDNQFSAQLLNIILTFFWLVGITNAFNLLDNMDGLAAGIALIASGILCYFFISSEDFALAAISLSLAGAVAGFLIYNFPPASIFMGDGGSLFIGFTLAVLAITRRPQASNVLAVIGVPILLFLLPILDTALVTITRILRGQSPVEGGRDHSSHRLIAFGLTERQTVFALYGIALLAGIAAALLEAIQYWYSLVLVPILVLSLAVLFAYLGGVKMLHEKEQYPRRTRFTRIILDLAFRKRLFEVGLDFILISLAYYLAFLIGSGLKMNEILISRYLTSLPVVLISGYTLFFSLGIYRSVWRYIGLKDLLLLLAAATGSVIFAAGFFFMQDAIHLDLWGSSDSPSALELGLFVLFLFIGLAASRSSFRILELLMPRKKSEVEIPVLIYGTADESILLVDLLLTQSESEYAPLGFIDDDPWLAGRWIHGLKVWGTPSQLESILTRKHVAGIILIGKKNQLDSSELAELCRPFNCWVSKIVINIEPVMIDSPGNRSGPRISGIGDGYGR